MLSVPTPHSVGTVGVYGSADILNRYVNVILKSAIYSNRKVENLGIKLHSFESRLSTNSRTHFRSN